MIDEEETPPGRYPIPARRASWHDAVVLALGAVQEIASGVHSWSSAATELWIAHANWHADRKEFAYVVGHQIESLPENWEG